MKILKRMQTAVILVITAWYLIGAYLAVIFLLWHTGGSIWKDTSARMWGRPEPAVILTVRLYSGKVWRGYGVRYSYTVKGQDSGKVFSNILTNDVYSAGQKVRIQSNPNGTAAMFLNGDNWWNPTGRKVVMEVFTLLLLGLLSYVGYRAVKPRHYWKS